MAKRTGGFIGQDGINAPDPATGVVGTAGSEQVSVAFTAPTDVGASAITGYRAQVAGIGTSGTSSPLVVTGLTNGTSYTANVWAINAFGTSSPSAASASFLPTLQRAIRGGGTTGGTIATDSVNVIDYVDITSTGNFSDFGDLSARKISVSPVSSKTRVVFEGGTTSGDFGYSVNVLEYITTASTGNVTDFGDGNSRQKNASAGSNTRGMFFGGKVVDTSPTNSIDYITIATIGNTTDFGDLSSAVSAPAACASATRAIVWGYDTTTIDYFTISSTGNSTDFGDTLVRTGRNPASFANSTRGIWAGGYYSPGINTIEFVTIASTGNATDFGDLTTATWDTSGTAGLTRGLIVGGYAGARVNTVSYVTILTAGNASDFGDLTTLAQYPGSASSAHGGLS